MADALSVLRRLQGEGIVAWQAAGDLDMVAASAKADQWQQLFASILNDAAEAVARVSYPRDHEYGVGYRVGFKHGVRAALEAVRQMREGL